MTVKRRTVVAGMAALAAATPIEVGTRRRAVHDEAHWCELPANSAVTIAALASKPAGRQRDAAARLDAGASGPRRDRGVS